MKSNQLKYIADALQTTIQQVEATVHLFEGGGTIPFIARYRKEVTGNLDEVQIGEIKSLMDKFLEADKRREGIIKSLIEQNKLTNELQKQLDQALFVPELEDIYLPYKPKRKTRATMAIERGLEPLAKIILGGQMTNIHSEARRFINLDVPTVDDALQGARDIIAEWISDDLMNKNRLRSLYNRYAMIYAKMKKGKENEGVKYKDYFDCKEPFNKMPSHRLLAILRGATEGILNVRIDVPEQEDNGVSILFNRYKKDKKLIDDHIMLSVQDAYKRLLKPALENEYFAVAKERADLTAVKIFSTNLTQLLLAPHLGQVPIIAIDPGFRTGAKLVVLSEKGELQEDAVIYPFERKQEAEQLIHNAMKKYAIKAIGIGNGTAGRETYEFIKGLRLNDVAIYMVSEQGASIYSASEVGREEFPHKDITVRGAISIGRRLLDPLAELVKLDPKTIGVGQYQHDVDQKLLRTNLDNVVISCVNKVGVELNTASKYLLSYVAGLSSTIAQNIIAHRQKIGGFTSRKQLMEVPRLGNKAFEQSAAFLRIAGAQHPLDNSAVHPESYGIVERMAKDVHTDIPTLMADPQARKKIDLQKYITPNVGMPTLVDILHELEKPGRDPRETLSQQEFANVHSIHDLKTGMRLPGVVTNVTAFGCFVDIGVHQDGLVHLSKLASKYVANPNEIVSLQQQVQVTVLEVDYDRKRINLSMID